ncbi:hypothetical protein ACLGIH_24695 [Streptomyces sp. HMX87]|uniref:hypothetical protein n=1 Tax=Streptomyces sp. HMX87 TaxID=3390849 RepID=UPI003A8C68D3
MWGSSHSYIVVPARDGRKVRYECRCGARGWETSSRHRADEMGREHVAQASRKGK